MRCPADAGCRAGQHRFAEQEQCRVVVQPAAHMGQQFVMEGGEGAGRLVGHMAGQPFGERVELPAVVAGLGDPFGVEQQLVPVGEGQHLKTGGLAGEGAQPEGRGRMGGL
ncbi:hypothetical protein AQJ91_18785, partial [Streptomyces dysideae]